MIAVDTNVLLYHIDHRDLVKRNKARQLFAQLTTGATPSVLIWQVAVEFLGQLRHWSRQGIIQSTEVHRHLDFVRQVFSLTLPTPAVLDCSLDLTDRFSLSHWDSLIIAACVEAGVDVLYTENMGAPIQYDRVQLVNPFV